MSRNRVYIIVGSSVTGVILGPILMDNHARNAKLNRQHYLQNHDDPIIVDELKRIEAWESKPFMEKIETFRTLPKANIYLNHDLDKYKD